MERDDPLPVWIEPAPAAHACQGRGGRMLAIAWPGIELWRLWVAGTGRGNFGCRWLVVGALDVAAD